MVGDRNVFVFRVRFHLNASSGFPWRRDCRVCCTVNGASPYFDVTEQINPRMYQCCAEGNQSWDEKEKSAGRDFEPGLNKGGCVAEMMRKCYCSGFCALVALKVDCKPIKQNNLCTCCTSTAAIGGGTGCSSPS